MENIIFNLKVNGIWKIKVLAFVVKVLNFVEVSDSKDANIVVDMKIETRTVNKKQ